MSSLTCTREQIEMALDAMWDDMAYKGYNTIEDVKARLAATIWPQQVAAIVVHAPPHSDTESEGAKRGRKKGPMSPEAKAKMVAKRNATVLAKSKAADAAPAVVVVAPAPEPEAKPLKVKAEKVKMTKEERSAAAKARYQALSEEAKAAIRDRMVTARAANKAAKASILEARENANED